MKALPLFPLNLVVYPFEDLSLHVFEGRYKQLISDCLEEDITFGVPTFMDDKLRGMGTEVVLTEIVNKYPDGRMDIRAKGKRVFKVKEFFPQMMPKLYAGGGVVFIQAEDDSNMSERLLLIDHAQKLLELLDQEVEVAIDEAFISYKIAHKMALSLSQEYHLLTLEKESERIQFLVDHLTRAIPIVREMERTKQRIRMNGHFKNFDPLKF